MKRHTKIWRNKLEWLVNDLYLNQRKTIREITEIIIKTKNINISREAVRNFINEEILHGITPKNTV
jgi:hypothetical protein